MKLALLITNKKATESDSNVVSCVLSDLRVTFIPRLTACLKAKLSFRAPTCVSNLNDMPMNTFVVFVYGGPEYFLVIQDK